MASPNAKSFGSLSERGDGIMGIRLGSSMPFRAVATALLLVGIAATAEAADPVADFYKGKQIRLLVSTPAGGIYDTLGRLMARHWGRLIPGNPTIVVENMPGASGLTAANYLANSAPRDGTVVVSAQSSVPLAEVLGKEGVRFKANDLTWIGSVSRETFIAYLYYKTAKIQTLDDTLQTEVVFGGQSPGSASIDMAIVARNLFGFKLKIVTGYPGSTQTKLAMEKGEIDGVFANGWSDLKTSQPDWLRDKTVRILVQHGLTRHPELPDVPLLLDWAKKPDDRQLLEVLLGRNEFSKPYFGPAGVPAERLAALRLAFERTMTDKDFLADAARVHADIDSPMTGSDLALAVARMSETPRPIVDRINAIFDGFTSGK